MMSSPRRSYCRSPTDVAAITWGEKPSHIPSIFSSASSQARSMASGEAVLLKRADEMRTASKRRVVSSLPSKKSLVLIISVFAESS